MSKGLFNLQTNISFLTFIESPPPRLTIKESLSALVQGVAKVSMEHLCFLTYHCLGKADTRVVLPLQLPVIIVHFTTVATSAL